MRNHIINRSIRYPELYLRSMRLQIRIDRDLLGKRKNRERSEIKLDRPPNTHTIVTHLPRHQTSRNGGFEFVVNRLLRLKDLLLLVENATLESITDTEYYISM